MGKGTRVRPVPVSTTAPTAAQNADAVWDEQKAGHIAANSYGKILQDVESDIAAVPTAVQNADQNWDEQKAGHVAANSFGKILQDIESSLGSGWQSRVFPSLKQATAVITGGSSDVNLPPVTIPNETDIGTIVKVLCMLEFRKIDNSDAGSNAINGAADVQVKKGAGAFADCINIVDNTMQTDGSAESGGDVIWGIIDIKGTIDAKNATYSFKFDDIQADAANLTIHDVQMFIKVYFTN